MAEQNNARGMIPLLIIAGPTASGKTALGVELAKKYGGEVVSADSMQIYRTMDIATAKPTAQEMDGVEHHLIGFVEPDTRFSVEAYAKAARPVIEEIAARGKLPILVGGTGLYIQAVADHLQFLPDPDPEKTYAVRQQLKQQLDEQGIELLYAYLQRVDPKACEKIHPANHKRVLRALEVFQTTGRTISEQVEFSRAVPSPYRMCMIALGCQDRTLLYQRIDERVDRMMEQGLLQECRAFFQSAFSETAMQAIGYKELRPFIEKKMPLQEAVAALKQATRRYAKRQITWLRKDPRYVWVDIADANDRENFIKKVVKIIEESGILCYNDFMTLP